ncbi:MAG: hypothetical protein CMH83_14620 [Nocardioides sp.]|nr:hypothetical protein [Nocardioides sp.]
MSIAVLGVLVTVVDVAQFAPQARRTLRLRHDPAALRGLSPVTWSLVTAQGLAWVVYGLGEGLWAVWLPNLVITPVAALVLGLRLRVGRPSVR